MLVHHLQHCRLRLNMLRASPRTTRHRPTLSEFHHGGGILSWTLGITCISVSAADLKALQINLSLQQPLISTENSALLLNNLLIIPLSESMR